MGLGSNKSV